MVDMARSVRAVTAGIARRVRLTARRAIIRLIDDAQKIQGAQLALFADELRWAERVQEYGYTSVPLPGAEAMALALGGSSDHTIVVAVDDRRYRLTGLSGGEVALYDDQGQRVHLKRNKAIEVSGCNTLTATAAVSITLTAPTINLVASTKINFQSPSSAATGNLSDSVRSMAADRVIYNGHTHNETQSVTNAPNQQQ